MKNRIHILFCCFILLVPFISCSQEIEDNVRVRISLESSNSQTVHISVSLEDIYGKTVDGAYILVRNKNGIYNTISYNPELCCYEAIFSLTAELIEVRIDSSLFTKPRVYEIPHKVISEKPVVSLICDSKGNSVFQGQKIDSSCPMQVSWTAMEDDCVYLIEIKNTFETLYSISTESTTVFIPENILKSGNTYYIKILAERISGDIFYETSDYYSINVMESSNYSFTTQ